MVQENSVNNKIIIISGPTAVGKSDLGVDCALKFDGEVVSADSMQIYERLDIGTGKITAEEMRGVKHHLLDIVAPDERYSVGQYLKDATTVIDGILAQNKLPVIVGGTGLYINALINGMNFSDADRSDEVREKWKAIASEKGNEYVYSKLVEIDPESAQKISPNDLKRTIRALEIYEVTGKPKSLSANTAECKYDYLFVILDEEREVLYQRINKRVDKMFALGLYDEVISLKDYAEHQSMQAIGYKQILQFLDGHFPDLESTKEEIKKLSRNYAKRQMTFLRSIKSDKKVWLKYENRHEIFDIITKFLKNED
ncbi:MAG: tRNA (adenosine(37)-N6)-dimethylallyltransferase MiaA [Clostridia bacterium]|nr:tRNA (adenosine(37)-N6)-dimethylallyltransferase MiaA [Clostridia bacterium]